MFLDEMEVVVPSKALLGLIEPHYPVAGSGRRPYPAMRKVVDDPEVKKRLALIGYTPAYLNSERFSSFVDEQQVLFTRVAKQASMKMSN